MDDRDGLRAGSLGVVFGYYRQGQQDDLAVKFQSQTLKIAPGRVTLVAAA